MDADPVANLLGRDDDMVCASADSRGGDCSADSRSTVGARHHLRPESLLGKERTAR